MTKRKVFTKMSSPPAIKMLGDIPDTLLPDGWIGVYHISGAIVYLHATTRVITWSRPYTISKETSLKKHNIPLMSIPCLHQKRAESYIAKGEEKTSSPNEMNEPSSKIMKIDVVDEVVDQHDRPSSSSCTGTKNISISTLESDASLKCPVTKITAGCSEFNANEISSDSLHEYIGRIFDFELLTSEQSRTPPLSYAGFKTQLAPDKDKINTEGKTPFQILNEYCQKELQPRPIIQRKQTASIQTIEIFIDNLKFGIGQGSSWKQAKHLAASTTLNILDYTILNNEDPSGYLKVFNDIPAHDKSVLPTIAEFSAMGAKYPYEMLVHILDQNFAAVFNESDIEYTTEDIGSEYIKIYKYTKYTMKYKEYQVSGECECSLPVKEVASQAFINTMYPQLKNWGSVIRLFEAHTNVLAWNVEEKEETTIVKEYLIF